MSINKPFIVCLPLYLIYLYLGVLVHNFWHFTACRVSTAKCKNHLRSGIAWSYKIPCYYV